MPTTLDRRQFAAGCTTAALDLPRLLGAAPAPREDRTLVVVQCRGGWDYLSLLVPAGCPVYHRARPTLAIPERRTLAIERSTDWRWHPALAAFRDLYDRGDLAVVHNVGHRHPTLSHFFSEAKWHTADPAGGKLMTGWLARWIRRHVPPSARIPGVTIDDRPSQAFAGVDVPTLLDVAALRLPFDEGGPSHRRWLLGELRREAIRASLARDPLLSDVAREIVASVDTSARLQQVGRGYAPRAAYGDTALAARLRTIARLIVGGLEARAYLTTMVGFDTHAIQAIRERPWEGELAGRLHVLSQAVRAFLDDLRAHGLGDRVLVMVYSEFGRRVNENAARGTEHGHGNVAFLAGAPVRGGLYGRPPDLAAIETPGVPFAIPFDERSMDYRRLHATVYERWFGVPAAPLLGGAFEPLEAVAP